MEIILKRIARRADYTIGRLFIGGQRICDTIEDTDRGLVSTMPMKQIQRAKVKGKTAIPTGTYRVTVTYSPRFKRNLPILCGVPCYEGIRIHSGNTAADTEGCILLGENKKVGMVLNSRHWTYEIVCPMIAKAVARKEAVWITVM